MEIWKDVINFEGIYEVSNLGNVRRKGTYENRKLGKHNFGYLIVDLYKNGKAFNKHVHRLVAESFIPNVENKPVVNHKDMNKQNNNVENLEWMTQYKNVQHSRNNGNIFEGSNHGCSKLNEKEAKEIYDLAFNKIYLQKEIAKIYNIDKSVVGRTKNKELWKHIHS